MMSAVSGTTLGSVGGELRSEPPWAWMGSTRSCVAVGAGCASAWRAPSVHLERVTAQAGAPARVPCERHDRRGRQAAAPAAGRAGRRVGGWAAARRREGEERLVRAAVAVELVHSATLVHDDLIDGAQLRRGHPTVAAAAGREARGRHRRSAVLAGVRRARAQRGRGAAARPLGRQLGAGRRRAAAARGRLRLARRGRALSAPLRAEDGGAVRGRLPPGSAHGCAGLGDARRRARGVRAPHRAGLSDARRRARRLRPGRAHRQGARHGPARRHGHAAVHPRARARARAGRVRPELAERPRAGRGAVRADRRDRCARRGPRAGAGGRRRGEGGAAGDPARTAARRCSTWWPTRSSSAIARQPGRARERGAPQR